MTRSADDNEITKPWIGVWMIIIICYFFYRSLDYFILSGHAYVAKESPFGLAHPEVLKNLTQHLKIMAAITSITCFMAGWRLSKVRYPESVALAIIAAWVAGPIAYLTGAALIQFHLDTPKLDSREGVFALISSMICPIAITLYLARSKRVRAIYQ